MSTPVTPLFFPEALTSRGLWKELGKTHGLTQKDFEWFSQIKLANQALRDEQTPPMLAKKILLKIQGLEPVALAGSFVLTALSCVTSCLVRAVRLANFLIPAYGV